jgi:hypothetical protein
LANVYVIFRLSFYYSRQGRQDGKKKLKARFPEQFSFPELLIYFMKNPPWRSWRPWRPWRDIFI